MSRFDFAFDERFSRLLWPLGIVPATAFAEVGREHLRVRFGPWCVTTRLDNIAGASVTGPFSWWRAIGVRVSLADRGLTLGTNTRQGVCLEFLEPVSGAEPFGVLRHPGLTLTIADPGGFMNSLEKPAAPAHVAVR